MLNVMPEQTIGTNYGGAAGASAPPNVGILCRHPPNRLGKNDFFLSYTDFPCKINLLSYCVEPNRQFFPTNFPGS